MITTPILPNDTQREILWPPSETAADFRNRARPNHKNANPYHISKRKRPSVPRIRPVAPTHKADNIAIKIKRREVAAGNAPFGSNTGSAKTAAPSKSRTITSAWTRSEERRVGE